MSVVVRTGDEDEVVAPGSPSPSRAWIISVAAAAAVAASWCWATLSGSVPLGVAGDESGRLLESYVSATPGGIIRLLTHRDAWIGLHPPGDVAFRAGANIVLGAVIHDPTVLVRVNQFLSTVLVVVGFAGISLGLRKLGVNAVVVFLGLAVPSAAVVYVAHHALGENLAIALVGIGTACLFRDRYIAGGILVGLAGLVRPEIALVFATLAVIPLAAREIKRCVVFATVAVGPALAQTLGAELVGTSYTSVDLFAHRSALDVGFRGAGPQVYWGLGVRPWVALIATVVIVVGGVRARVSWRSAGRLLLAGWLSWSMVFVVMAARGAIPPQIRTYVVLHVFGALALAVAASELMTTWRPVSSRVLAVVASAIIVLAGIAAVTTRGEWRAAYPRDVAAVSRFLADHHYEGGVLTDWMWWREWTVGVYGIEPGGEVCNYALCSETSSGVPPPAMTSRLSAIETERLTRAWRYVAKSSPRFVAMFNRKAYLEWRRWEKRAHPEVLSSFVRPLFTRDRQCFVTVRGLPAARYCPVFTAGRFVVLEHEP
jgi:hypothetical protein